MFFKKESLPAGRYTFALQVVEHLSTGQTLAGKTEVEVFINGPPTGGSVSICAGEGAECSAHGDTTDSAQHSFRASFAMPGSDTWKDENAPLEYFVAASTEKLPGETEFKKSPFQLVKA